ncbi:dolichyl-phosphate-mannose-protein mannosyltransferase [Nematocida sp. LUAm3]|nr:dolichyl-phosphate-mannose-protein mannosyltransferase [Nematocida sp. LUAm3]KAI5176171.1 dolichyl-phosphate-mannose-protein mannosyltransferase [Nematocida sp. LUAm2]KAI5179265.1 dolichyl-phosphate-mannose-protein mannosyltransferase [Nematocida sp. LUAm1]
MPWSLRIAKNKEATLFLLTFLLRFFFISYPGSIVFDELHYVKFIGSYLKEEVVIDVHPPLGRLFMYWITKMSLSSGEDPFRAGERLCSMRVGDAFTGTPMENVYLLLRGVSVILSSILSVVVYKTLLLLRIPSYSSFLISFLFLFESSIHCVSRVFMVDSYVLLCCGVAFYSLIRLDRWSKWSSRKAHCASFFSSLSLFLSSLGWISLLGVSIGLGMSFKWSILPIGLPIAGYLVMDLRRSIKAYGRNRFRWMYSFAHSFILLALMLGIYFSVFLVNFSFQGKYSSSCSLWYSSSFLSTLKGSPFSGGSSSILPHTPVSLFLKDSSLFLEVDKESNGLVLSSHSKFPWRVERRENDEYALSYVDGDGSVLYFSLFSSSLLSSSYSTIPMSITPLYAYIRNKGGEALFFSKPLNETQELDATWKKNGSRFILLSDNALPHNTLPDGTLPHDALHDALHDGAVSNWGGIMSHVHPGYSIFRKFWEANRVMVDSNKSLKNSQHKYAAFPGSWINPLYNLHMWSGGTSDIPSDQIKFGSKSQIYFMYNKINMLSSVLSVSCLFLFLLTTKIPNSSSLFLLLLSYFSNYLPYFFLSREMYLHHYLISYFFSLLLLSYFLSSLPNGYIFIFLFFSGMCFLVEFPLLTGLPSSYELSELLQCFHFFTNYSSLLNDSFDSYFINPGNPII